MKESSREMLHGQRLLMPILGVTKIQLSVNNSGVKDQSIGNLGKSATSRMYLKQSFKTLKKETPGAANSREISKRSSKNSSASIFDLTASRIARGKTHVSKLLVRPREKNYLELHEGNSFQEALALNRLAQDQRLAALHKPKLTVYHTKHSSLGGTESLINQLQMHTARNEQNTLRNTSRGGTSLAALRKPQIVSQSRSRSRNNSRDSLVMPISLPMPTTNRPIKLRSGKPGATEILKKPFSEINQIAPMIPLESKIVPLPRHLEVSDNLRKKSKESKSEQVALRNATPDKPGVQIEKNSLSPSPIRPDTVSPLKSSMITLDSQVGLIYKPMREKSCEKGNKAAKDVHSKVDIAKFKNWLLSDPLTKQLYHKVTSIRSSK